MIAKVFSAGLGGIRGYPVSVECSLSAGLPAFDLVGLPDAAVREARERVRSAIKNCGLSYPVSRITVNLAPADRKKAGTVYDLPVLLGILAAGQQIEPLPADCAFFGELSLDGTLRPVSGALPMAIAAGRAGMTRLFLPAENASEAAFAGNIRVYPVRNVPELLAHLNGTAPIAPLDAPEPAPTVGIPADFADVRGQENVKRALEVAAAGGHNILLIGPPGSGKSMLAKRLPSILPDMSRTEMLESTEIHSVAGFTNQEHPIVNLRPFRSPHHTVSPAAMSGGTSSLRPGEISLAHNGVLFLDELPEFPKEVLEVMRQPLEDGQVTVSRASGSATYPSRFMLVCAMNPCKCGWYGSSARPCTCSPGSVRRYLDRLSGPLLDRIDMYIEVPALAFGELTDRAPAERSADIKKRVDDARSRQRSRYRDAGFDCNAQVASQLLDKYCTLDDECRSLMQNAFDNLGLTARSFDRILRVARTVADLDGAETITPAHLAEAIQYRTYALRP